MDSQEHQEEGMCVLRGKFQTLRCRVSGMASIKVSVASLLAQCDWLRGPAHPASVRARERASSVHTRLRIPNSTHLISGDTCGTCPGHLFHAWGVGCALQIGQPRAEGQRTCPGSCPESCCDWVVVTFRPSLVGQGSITCL